MIILSTLKLLFKLNVTVIVYINVNIIQKTDVFVFYRDYNIIIGFSEAFLRYFFILI